MIDSDKANDIKNLEGIGEVVWGFILAFYESHWDYLITDKNNFSFRQKVKAQFNSQINRDITLKKGKEAEKLASVSVIPPLISAKSPKEVIEISKFFKKISDNKGKKSYVQALSSLSSNSNIAREMLKIKEAFPNLKN